MENIRLLGLPGVCLTDSQGLSSPEGPSYVGHKPKEKAWRLSRLRPEAPRGPAHKRGPDSDQYDPQEHKTNLLRPDMHHIPTQTVVILKTDSSLMVFQYFSFRMIVIILLTSIYDYYGNMNQIISSSMFDFISLYLFICCKKKKKFCCLVLGQDIDHTYYTSKIYGPGDAASKELQANRDETWKVCAFLSSSYRQTEV